MPNLQLKLTRISNNSCGVFGELSDDNGQICVTLEHAYPFTYAGTLRKVWHPKLPPTGVYNCIRGLHRLAGYADPFETFEITNVPGHTGILFHIGNYNDDSDGCILLGKEIIDVMITDSLQTFTAFMKRMTGINSFQLTVL